MAKCKVWNRHTMGLTHTEMFKDKKYVIPAGEFIEMDYEEAVQFVGNYFPMKRTPDGEPDPKTWKMLKIDDIGEATTKSNEFICHFDGKKFPTQSSLEFHIKENYSDRIIVDESAEKELVKEKRGPGRPAKTA